MENQIPKQCKDCENKMGCPMFGRPKVTENQLRANKMKTVKYDVWSLDVWGNEQDGFDVNDRSCFQRAVEFPTTHKVYNQGTPREFSDDWPTDEQIIQTLIDIGYLVDNATMTDIQIDGEPDSSLWIEDTKDGFPICQLEYVDNS